jgi:DNA-binding HxlR family transcriptional regulator
MTKGTGNNQIEKAKESKRTILASLQTGDWFRYQNLQKQTGVSSATLSKHLKELEKGIIEKKIDMESGKYPYPVYYRIKPEIITKLTKIRKKAEELFAKSKQSRNSLHWLNFNTGLLLISLLKEYIKNPTQNEKMFSQATEYNIISLYRNYIDAIKLKMKDYNEKGEDVNQLLTDFQNQILKDYNFMIKEMVTNDGLISQMSIDDLKGIFP